MRTLLLLLVFGIAALSGCVTDDSPEEPAPSEGPLDTDSDGYTDSQEEAAGSDPADAASKPMIPEPLVYTGTMRGMGDVSSNAPCAGGDAQCTTIDVPVAPGRWRATFTLHSHDGMVTSQGIPYGSDYELNVLGQLSTNSGDQAEVITGIVEGGTVPAEIQAWHDIDGSYELIVEFALP